MDKLQQIIRVIIVGIGLIFSCYLTGSLVNKKWKISSGQGIFMGIFSICIVGWLIEVAVFQIICVPMVIYNAKFTDMVSVYLICIAVLSAAAVLICRKGLFLLPGCNPRKKRFSPYRIAAVVLILFQMVFFVFFVQWAEDGIMDYSLASQTISHNTMFRHYVYTGYECTLDYWVTRFTQSWYMYRAFLSLVTQFHPTMVGRTLLPPVMVFLSYCSYWKVGKYLLKDDEKTDIFMIILCAINIFGNMRLTPMICLMTDAVNGKSVFINILFPFIIMSILKLYENYRDKKQYLFLILLNICAVAMSTTALFYGALTTVLMLGIVAWKRKKLQMFFWACLIVVPNILYLSLYFLEKRFKLWL